MDPITVTGIVASVVSVADVVTKSIRKFSELRSRYSSVPHNAAVIVGELVIVQAALEELASWTPEDRHHDARYSQLASQIGGSLDHFAPLIRSLYQRLGQLDVQQTKTACFRQKSTFQWDEHDMNKYLNLIVRQVNVLSLLLQAIQCRSWSEQQEMMADDTNQTILQQAKECRFSVIKTADSSGLNPEYDERPKQPAKSEASTAINAQLALDVAAHRSHLRQAFKCSHPFHKIKTSTITKTLPVDKLESESYVQLHSEPPITLNPAFSKSDSHLKRVKTNEKALPKSTVSISASEAIRAPIKEAKETVTEGKTTCRLKSKWLEPDNPSQAKVSCFQKSAPSKKRNVQTLPHETSHTQHHQDPSQVFESKVLLLGAAESGKSTLSRALQLHCGDVDNTPSRRMYSQIVHDNILAGTWTILKAMEEFSIAFDKAHNHHHASTIPEDCQAWGRSIPAEIVTALSSIWADLGFLKAYKYRYESSLPDCAREFVKDIHRLADSNYIPTFEDLLKVRVRTTGAHQTKLASETRYFSLWDTGGERAERKKWYRCFPETSVMVFTVDVTACERHRLVEAEGNRMHEQLMLFETLINGKWFKPSNTLVVFTKVDLLEDILHLETQLDRWDVDLKPLLEGSHTLSSKERTEVFLSRLESRFRSTLRDEEQRDKMKFFRADLVHSGADKVMTEILQALRDAP